MNGKSDLFDMCAGIVRAQAELMQAQPPAPHPVYPADRLWSELNALYRELEQLQNETTAKTRRMQAVCDELKALVAARNLPGLSQ